jgi:hypothetical protein
MRILEGEIGGGKFLMREVGVLENACVVTVGSNSKLLDHVPNMREAPFPPSGVNGKIFRPDVK